MTADISFKLSYSTMFNHLRATFRYAEVLARLKNWLGKEHGRSSTGRIIFRSKTLKRFADRHLSGAGNLPERSAADVQ